MISIKVIHCVTALVNHDALCSPLENAAQYVGKPTFTSDRLYEEGAPPGVVMGLAWTAMGGSSLYIEAMAIRPPDSVPDSTASGSKKGRDGSASRSSGGRLRTTGQLGDVMNESAQVSFRSSFFVWGRETWDVAILTASIAS